MQLLITIRSHLSIIIKIVCAVVIKKKKAFKPVYFCFVSCKIGVCPCSQNMNVNIFINVFCLCSPVDAVSAMKGILSQT